MISVVGAEGITLPESLVVGVLVLVPVGLLGWIVRELLRVTTATAVLTSAMETLTKEVTCLREEQAKARDELVEQKAMLIAMARLGSDQRTGHTPHFRARSTEE